jgi:hypothetical protein
MDSPHPEDVDVGFDPLDVVEHVLSAENLEFDRTEDGDLAFALAGDWKDYELWFAWRPEADCLQLCLSLDLRAPKSRRAASYELLSLINQRVWLGHFEVWTEDGEIVFRHSLPLPTGERPTLAQAASMIDAAVGRPTASTRPSTSSCAGPRTPRTPWPPACSRPSARPEGRRRG